MQMIEMTARLSEAMHRFAEACRQASWNMRDLQVKYGDYMRRPKIIHRPVQRLDKKRRHHG